MTVVVALGAATLLAVLPRREQRITVQADAIGPFIADGETVQLRNFFGFREPEQAGETPFRWTSGEASFVVRNGMALGAPLLLDVRLCGCHASDAPAPLLTLRVNGATLAETRTTAHWDEWRRYRVLLPQHPLPNDDLLVELLSDYVPNAESGDPLGIAFQRAVIAPLGVQRAYNVPAALGLGVLISIVSGIVVLRSRSMWRASLVGALALALTAVQGFIGSALLPVWALAAGLVLCVGAGVLLQRQKAKSEGQKAKSNPSTARPFTFYLLPFALMLPIVLTQLLGTWMLDDAFISFRYARNALLGNGFVFNSSERVEGYTNFLWTALFVPFIGWNFDPARTSQVLTLLLALIIAALTWVGARRVASVNAVLVALALLVTSAPFLLYTARGSGMETALFTALVLAGTLLSTGARSQEPGARSQEQDITSLPLHLFTSGALLGLAAMTRPEGVLVAGVTGCYLLWRAFDDRRPTNDDRQAVLAHPASRILYPAITFALGFLIIFGPYYVWRYSYYGFPLPNTFYAKVGGSGAQAIRGLAYASDFALAQAPLVILAALSYVRFAAKHFRPSATSAVVGGPWSFVVPVYALYIIAVGGDHFPYYRFFVPLLPLLAMQAAAGLDRLARLAQQLRFRSEAWLPLVVVVLGIGYHAPQLYESRTLNTDERVWGENSVVEKNREIGLWLRANTSPDTLISTGIAGALPYYSERPVLDALGLNDLHIAHMAVPTMGAGTAGAEKTDVPYILGRRPAYIPYNSAEPFQTNPTFAASYRRMTVRGPEGRAIRLYRRADIPAPPGSREVTQ